MYHKEGTKKYEKFISHFEMKEVGFFFFFMWVGGGWLMGVGWGECT